MKKQQLVAAGICGAALGSAVYIQAGSDSNGDGFLEFVDGEVITADDINTNYTRTADHVTTYESAIMVTEDGTVGLGDLPLDDESLYIFQDETGTGSHLNLRLYKLEGGNMLQLGDAVDYDFNFGIDADSAYGFLGDSGYPELLVLRNGNIGIGTSNPQRKLVVQNDSTGGTTTGALYNANTTSNNATVLSFRTDTSGSGATSFKEVAGITARTTQHDNSTRNTNLEFFTDDSSGGSTKMVILGDGKVGIGTTTPSRMLTVVGAPVVDGDSGSQFRIQDNTAYNASPKAGIHFSAVYNSSGQTAGMGGINVLKENSTDGDYGSAITIMNRANGGSLTERLRLSSAGFLGIGTVNPLSRLDVNGGIRATDICDETGSNCKDISTGWGTSSQWTTSGSHIYYSSGNVGIGTASPDFKLAIQAGDAAISLKDTTGTTRAYVGIAGIDGSAATNALRLRGDSGIMFSIGGFPVTTINTSGSIGVGTTSPVRKLDVSVGTSADGVRISTSDSGSLNIERAASGLFSIGAFDTNNAIRFMTTSVERMRLDSSGNLGMGTTAPAARFDVVGGSAETDLIRISSTSTSPYFIIQGDRSSATPGGAILFRTSRGSGSPTSANGDLMGQEVFLGHDGTDYGTIAAMVRGNIDGTVSSNVVPGRLSFFTAPTTGSDAVREVMRINSSGYLGIGTTSPQARLHVGSSNQEIRFDYDGTSNYYGSLRWAGLQLGNNGINKIVAGRTSTGGLIDFYVNNTNDGADYSQSPNGIMALRLNSNGNIGIGTTSASQRVHIGASRPSTVAIRIDRNDGVNRKSYIGHDGNGFYIQTGDTSDDDGDTITFRNSSGSTMMYVLPTNGNIGIGTSSPSYKLHVGGEAAATNFITTSDARLKRDIEPLNGALSGIACLQGVTFYWKDPDESASRQMGLIAQEVEACFPDAVTRSKDGVMGVLYGQLVAPLVEAVKELAAQLDDQGEELTSQRALNEVQERKIETQQQRIDALEAYVKSSDARFAAIERRLSGHR